MANKLRIFQNLLALSAVALIIIVWSTVTYLAFQNKKLKLYMGQNTHPLPTQTDEFKSSTSIPTPPIILSFLESDIPNWQKYVDNKYDFSIEFPKDWNFTIKSEFPEAPVYYISKDKSTIWRGCHNKTSCLMIQPNMGGRGGYMFMIKTKQYQFKNNNVVGSRTDFFSYDGNLYSSFVSIDNDPQRPLWTGGIIDIFPKIINEKYSATGLLPTPGKSSFESKLESVTIDSDDLIVLDQILSTFRFTE